MTLLRYVLERFIRWIGNWSQKNIFFHPLRNDPFPRYLCYKELEFKQQTYKMKQSLKLLFSKMFPQRNLYLYILGIVIFLNSLCRIFQNESLNFEFNTRFHLFIWQSINHAFNRSPKAHFRRSWQTER